MAINFPDSPTVGATYTVGSITWQWNGTTWTSTGSNAASELALKAPKASPTFTGTVTTPLSTAGYVKTSAAGVLSSSAAIAQADVTNLTSDLAGKAATSHTHTKSQITDFAHTHAQSDVTNLASDLSAKANLSGATFSGAVQMVVPNGASSITSRINSGNYENSVPTTAGGWPVTGSWYHLMANTHSNTGNYYSQQFASDFFDSSNVFHRSTNGNGATAWRKIATGIGAVTYSTGDPSGGNDGDVWLKYTP